MSFAKTIRGIIGALVSLLGNTEMSSFYPSTFGFLSTDVARQFQLSREFTAEVSGIDDVIKRLEDIPAIDRDLIEKLRAYRSKILKLAKALVENASTTASTGTSVLSSVTISSTGGSNR